MWLCNYLPGSKVFVKSLSISSLLSMSDIRAFAGVSPLLLIMVVSACLESR